MKDLNTILKKINLFSNAYRELDEIQRKSKFLPVGDQKTGIIGELYVLVYLKHLHNGYADVYLSHNPSNKVWDICVKYLKNSTMEKIQVKTVSEFSESRSTSPVHSGWDYIYFVLLDKEFVPSALWIGEKNEPGFQSSLPKRFTLPNLKDTKKVGSEVFKNRENEYLKLIHSMDTSTYISNIIL
ncbi:hypothetical protein [Paenibacillus sp. FSL K6-1318]|uniref:hypothetical protein n=1 Tax=Paenibacillus sp. FSL K6-1318 TaxID=2975291 RepID=UPI0030EF3780